MYTDTHILRCRQMQILCCDLPFPLISYFCPNNTQTTTEMVLNLYWEKTTGISRFQKRGYGFCRLRIASMSWTSLKETHVGWRSRLLLSYWTKLFAVKDEMLEFYGLIKAYVYLQCLHTHYTAAILSDKVNIKQILWSSLLINRNFFKVLLFLCNLRLLL